MDYPIYKTVLGLRYKRTFSFTATSGKLIDDLLSKHGTDKDKYLGFKYIANKKNGMGVQLRNELGNFTLDIDIDGVVVSHHYTKDDPMNESRLVDWFDGILPNSLKMIGAQKTINRVGIVNYFTFENRKNASEDISKKLIKHDLKGIPDNFALRFALKNPTPETQVRQDTLDYTNVIYNVKSEKMVNEEESTSFIDIDLDYQIYYNPEKSYSKGMIKDHYKAYLKYIESEEVKRIVDFSGESKDGE